MAQIHRKPATIPQGYSRMWDTLLFLFSHRKRNTSHSGTAWSLAEGRRCQRCAAPSKTWSLYFSLLLRFIFNAQHSPKEVSLHCSCYCYYFSSSLSSSVCPRDISAVSISGNESRLLGPRASQDAMYGSYYMIISSGNYRMWCFYDDEMSPWSILSCLTNKQSNTSSQRERFN